VVEAVPSEVPDLVEAEVAIATEPATVPNPEARLIKINPNLDAIEKLESLPHIGAKLAERIVGVRAESEFTDFDDFYKRVGLKLKTGEKEQLANLLEFKF
jgi:DNA uptake protein ComE-like DNA-binding protein